MMEAKDYQRRAGIIVFSHEEMKEHPLEIQKTLIELKFLPYDVRVNQESCFIMFGCSVYFEPLVQGEEIPYYEIQVLGDTFKVIRDKEQIKNQMVN